MTIARTDDQTFVPGTTYATRSICNYDCIYRVRVIRRTAKSVWVDVHGEVVRRSVRVCPYEGVEVFEPFGRYSMCPTISANKVAA
jgi:hypothetical protein